MGDPASAAAIASLGSAAIGTKQVAPAQPSIPPSAGGADLGKEGLLASIAGASKEPVLNPVQMSMSGLSEQPPAEQPGPPVDRAGSEESSGFSDKFFGGIDNTFQSPAKLLGVGLLNQIKPGAGTLGLGLAGLLGAFRK